MHRSTYAQEINRILARMNTNGSEGKDEDTKPLEEKATPEEYDVYVQTDRITIVKRPELEAQVIEAVQPPQPQPQPYVAYIAMTMSLLLILYLVTAAFITTFFPPVVTIMIMPKSHIISLTGTLQLGRLLQPITVSQSQTVPTTGKGHQTAKSATGFITFYNGLFSSQTMQAGTVLTGADGIQIITDQEADIPEASPPNLGYATVTAHATQAGSNGNIHAFDINQACCATAIKAVNTTAFHGGQDERNYETVVGQDIDNAASPLKASISASMKGALQGQVKPQEHLQLFPCTPTTTSDHQIGAEATKVTVTVSQTCSGVAYNSQTLETRAMKLLTAQAITKLETGYSLIGNVQVRVKDATVTNTTQPLVFVSFHAQVTWIYALSYAAQQQIKHLIAGKRKQDALRLLLSIPGIQEVSISGIDDLTKLPNSTRNMWFVLLV